MKLARLVQQRNRFSRTAMTAQPDTKPETGVRQSHIRCDSRQLRLCDGGIQRVPSSTHPVSNRIQIRRSAGKTSRLVFSGHRSCNRIDPPKMIRRPRRLRRPDDVPGFVDPHALRNVYHPVQRRNPMIDVDQAPIGCLGLLDPRTRVFRTPAFLRHRDNGEIFGLQAVKQLLPHGQVKATASPGRPRRKKHFPAAQVRQPMRHPAQVGQREIRSLKPGQRLCSAFRGRTKDPDAASLIGHDRMTQRPPERRQVHIPTTPNVLRQRNAKIIPAHAFRFQRPSGHRLGVPRRNPQTVTGADRELTPIRQHGNHGTLPFIERRQ
jgi:hypothetical protein